MSIAIIALITTLATALLPLLVGWLNHQMEKPSGIEQLQQRNSAILDQQSRGLVSGSAVDVASAWAKHDQLLRDRGITARPPDNTGGSNNRRQRGRNVDHKRGMDGGTNGVRARTTDPTRSATERTVRVPKRRLSAEEIATLPQFQPFD